MDPDCVDHKFESETWTKKCRLILPKLVFNTGPKLKTSRYLGLIQQDANNIQKNTMHYQGFKQQMEKDTISNVKDHKR